MRRGEGEQITPAIREGDVEWSYEKITGDDKLVFEDCAALAVLLREEVIFLNNHWWMEDWPEAAKKTTSLNVDCSDVFAWGCADAEEVAVSELDALYRMWRKDPVWGASDLVHHQAEGDASEAS